MPLPGILALLSALAGLERRAAVARSLADALGIDEVVVLFADPDVGVLLPVAGLRKTLPGGPEWRGFLQRCREPGRHAGSLPWPLESIPVAACSTGRVALVLLGGPVADAHAELLCDALPLLEEALSTQQALAAARGELATARAELVQSTSLTRALDDARRQVDRALIELGAKARALETANQRAEAAMRTKDEFLAMLGHELRNPLAPIVTALELVRQRGQWSPEHDIMRRQVEHMLRLVDDLLDVTRIATGKLALDLGPVVLDDVIGRATESVRPLVDADRPLRVDVPTGLAVRGDAQRLTQVFSNLLTNALKYSDPGTPVALVARADGRTAFVDVIDRGIGIEPAHLESVFELFEQQGRGIDRAQGGLGLGLAIVRNLVRLHGGSVYAESSGPGCGSRFTVELPLAESIPVAAQASTPPAEATAGGRVMLVDDNVDALTTLAMALEMAGYEVRTANDGETALELALRHRPHAAVLDIGLPGINGYELAGALRIADPLLRLVALTGYGQEGDRQRAADAGFDAHLVKPVDFHTLAEILATLVHRDRDVPELCTPRG